MIRTIFDIFPDIKFVIEKNQSPLSKDCFFKIYSKDFIDSVPTKSSDNKTLDVTNLFKINESENLNLNSIIKIENKEKFNVLLNKIRKRIEEVDKLDKNFVNPRFFDPKNFSKIIKITIIHKEFKEYFNFNKNDLRLF